MVWPRRLFLFQTRLSGNRWPFPCSRWVGGSAAIPGICASYIDGFIMAIHPNGPVYLNSAFSC